MNNYFVYIAEASRNTLIDKSLIIKSCNGKIKTAGGFIWEYRGDEDGN